MSIITPKIGQIIIESIQEKSLIFDSPILAANHVHDHIHIAVSIPPKLAVSQWVRQIKGVSSHKVNAMFPDLEQDFAWQKGYGVLTIR